MKRALRRLYDRLLGHKPVHKRTAFDQDFDTWMEDPEFAAVYERRSHIYRAELPWVGRPSEDDEIVAALRQDGMR